MKRNRNGHSRTVYAILALWLCITLVPFSSFAGSVPENGVENDLSHTTGTLSMARSATDPDSASAQFFICLTDKDVAMDGKYAAFGRVTDGLDKVLEISKVEKVMGTDKYLSQPVFPVTIEKAEIVDPDAEGNTQVKFTVSYYVEK